MKTSLFKNAKKEYETLSSHPYIGRTFVSVGTHVIMLATPNDSAKYVDNTTVVWLGKKFEIEEDEIENYPYFKHHLSKAVKKELLK